MTITNIAALWTGLGGAAAGVLCVALAAWAGARLTASAGARKAVWQMGMASLGVLAALEWTGVGARPAEWISGGASRESETRLAIPAVETPTLAWAGTEAGELLEVDEAPVSNEGFVLGASERAVGGMAAEERAPESRDADGLGWVGAVWLAGSGGLLARRLGLGVILAWAARRRRGVPRDAELDRELAEVSAAFGFSGRLRVLESETQRTPSVFGVFRPTLCLPRGFQGQFQPEQRKVILAHELAHLAGRDPAWQLCGDLVAAALWWHPLVWWLRRRMGKAMETVADEASLMVENGPSILAECLVRLGGGMAKSSSALGIGGFRSGLGRRVEHLLALRPEQKKGGRQFSRGVLQAAGFCALVGVALMGAAWTQPHHQSKGKNMNPSFVLKHTLAGWLGMAALVPSHPSLEAAEKTLPITANSPPEIEAGSTSGASSLGAAVPVAPGGAPPGAGIPSMGPGQNRAVGVWRSPGQPGRGGAIYRSKAAEAVEDKLKELRLAEFACDAAPLGEVLKDLSATARHLDPERKGINFVFDRSIGGGGGIDVDPNTGMAVEKPARQLGDVIITVQLPLRDVSLKDALEVVVKGAEIPIRYSVEPFGVVFSHAAAAPDVIGAMGSMGHYMIPSPSESLQVRTFRISEETLRAGAEQILDVSEALPESGREILDLLLQRLGIDTNPPNVLIYNSKKGAMMVRAPGQDLALLEATLELLGDTDEGAGAAVGGGGGSAGGGSASPPTRLGGASATYQMDPALMRRYGLLPAGSQPSGAAAGGGAAGQAEKKNAGGGTFVMEPELMRRYGIRPQSLEPAAEHGTQGAGVAKGRAPVAVLGAVQKPGNFFQIPDETPWTVLNAIAAAGGFAENANTNKIELQRKGVTHAFSLKELKNLGKLPEGPEKALSILEPGDVIIVGERVF